MSDSPTNAAPDSMVPKHEVFPVAPRRRRMFRLYTIFLIGLLVIPLALWLGSLALQARESARRNSCNCNLKIIGLALQNYCDSYGTFPPAFVADKDGRPAHSWRVLILPFLNEQELYSRYRMDEPWDGPSNLRLVDEMPRVYHCPSRHPLGGRLAFGRVPQRLLACTGSPSSATTGERYTAYAAATGPHCVFQGIQGCPRSAIRDGEEQTVVIGEITDAAILWTRPADIDVTLHPQIGDTLGFSSDHRGSGTHLLFAAGFVKYLMPGTPQNVVNALLTRAGSDNATIPEEAR